MPILNFNIFLHLDMFHVKKKIKLSGEQFNESCKTQIQLYIYLTVQTKQLVTEGDFEAKEVPLF